MARYLRSQTTGVVLPYNEKLLKRPNIEVLTPAECTAYEIQVKTSVQAAAVHPDVVVPTTTDELTPDVVIPTSVVEEPTSVVEEPTSVVEEPTVSVTDVSEGEPSAKELLAALEID